jgi:hypothetical protein
VLLTRTEYLNLILDGLIPALVFTISVFSLSLPFWSQRIVLILDGSSETYHSSIAVFNSFVVVIVLASLLFAIVGRVSAENTRKQPLLIVSFSLYAVSLVALILALFHL